MNLFFIDTSDQDLFLALKSGDRFSFQAVDSRPDLQKTFFNQLTLFLERNDVSLNAIDKVGVIKGPGAYSSLRIGLIFVKTLSLMQRIPLLAFEKMDFLLAGQLDDGRGEETAVYLINSSENHYFLYHYSNGAVLKRWLLSLKEVEDFLNPAKWSVVSGRYFTTDEANKIKMLPKNRRWINLLGWKRDDLSDWKVEESGCFIREESLTELKKKNYQAFFKSCFHEAKHLVSPLSLSPFYVNRWSNKLF